MSAPNPPAFPPAITCTAAGDTYHGYDGMSLRDFFAAHALSGLLASGKWDNCGGGFEAFIADHAGNIADAMIAGRTPNEIGDEG